jgi:hypothetical protein
MILLASNINPFPFVKTIGLPSPILEYTFDSDDFTDTSGFGHTGYGEGTPTFVAGKGSVGRAVNLNGTSQWFGMPSDPQWDELNGKDFSLAMWVKIPVKNWTANITQIIGTLTMDTTVPAYWWGVTTQSTLSTILPYISATTGEIQPAGIGDIVSANYKLLIMTKVGATYQVYLDNVAGATGTLSPDGNVDNIYSVIVGGFYARHVAMQVDSVRFYDFGLSTEERQAIQDLT